MDTWTDRRVGRNSSLDALLQSCTSQPEQTYSIHMLGMQCRRRLLARASLGRAAGGVAVGVWCLDFMGLFHTQQIFLATTILTPQASLKEN